MPQRWLLVPQLDHGSSSKGNSSDHDLAARFSTNPKYPNTKSPNFLHFSLIFLRRKVAKALRWVRAGFFDQEFTWGFWISAGSSSSKDLPEFLYHVSERVYITNSSSRMHTAERRET